MRAFSVYVIDPWQIKHQTHLSKGQTNETGEWAKTKIEKTQWGFVWKRERFYLYGAPFSFYAMFNVRFKGDGNLL